MGKWQGSFLSFMSVNHERMFSSVGPRTVHLDLALLLLFVRVHPPGLKESAGLYLAKTFITLG